MHHHNKQLITSGKTLKEASRVMIMIHGRGATAESILSLADHLPVDDFALIAPQATMNTWYPYSFMAPVQQNEPALSSALELLEAIVDDIQSAGHQAEDIYFLGFSQGACLSSEYVARNAKRYGGVFVLSGGIIGAEIDRNNYQGDFQQTPILLGCSDVDAHIPLQRVKDSTRIFQEMGANVSEQIYPNAPHTVFQEELDFITRVIHKSP